MLGELRAKQTIVDNLRTTLVKVSKETCSTCMTIGHSNTACGIKHQLKVEARKLGLGDSINMILEIRELALKG